MAHLDAAERVLNAKKMRKEGEWGIFHELGHNMQRPAWTWPATVEVTCNLFTLYTMERVVGRSFSEANPHFVPTTRAANLARHVARGAPYSDWAEDPFLALYTYVDLIERFGWGALKSVFEMYETLEAEIKVNSEREKIDKWVLMFSQAVGHNLCSFFVSRGVPVSRESSHAVEHLPHCSITL